MMDLHRCINRHYFGKANFIFYFLFNVNKDKINAKAPKQRSAVLKKINHDHEQLLQLRILNFKRYEHKVIFHLVFMLNIAYEMVTTGSFGLTHLNNLFIIAKAES